MRNSLQIVFSVCLICLLGLAIPFLVPMYATAMSNILIVIVALLLAVTVTKGRIGVHEWLIIFLVLIPLHSFTIGSELFFLRLTEIAFIPFFAVWLFQKRTGTHPAQRSFPPEYSIVFFFVALSFISMYKAEVVLVSLHRTMILTYLAVFSYIVWDILAGNKQKIFMVVRAMVVIASITGGIGILQAFIPQLYPFYHRGYMTIAGINIIRAGAGWYDPSYFGLYLSMIIPLTVSLLRSDLFFNNKKVLRYCLWVQWGGLLASGSRASILATFVAYLFLLWVGKKQKIAFTILVLVILFVSIAFVGMPYVYNEFPALAAFMFRIPHLQTVMVRPELILGWRLDAWRANIAMFLDNPFIGVGPFMAGYRYKDYYPKDHLYPFTDILHPHSEYLSLL